MPAKRSLLLAAAALALFAQPTLAQGDTPPGPDANAALVAGIRLAPPSERADLVKAALAANPRSAPALVAALITAFPGEAAAYTKLVVDALLATDLPADIKGATLAEVARNAVQAALQIPPAAVADLLATVNEVKAALAGVPPSFLEYVAAHTTPLTRLPETVLLANTTGGTLPTQTILSDDTL